MVCQSTREGNDSERDREERLDGCQAPPYHVRENTGGDDPDMTQLRPSVHFGRVMTQYGFRTLLIKNR